MPRIEGGTDDTRNLIAACQACKAIKGNRRLIPDLERELQTLAWISEHSVERLAADLKSAEAKPQVFPLQLLPERSQGSRQRLLGW